MATSENSNRTTEGVDDSSTELAREGSYHLDLDKEIESLWGIPSGPPERLPGESVPDYWQRRGFPASSAQQGQVVTIIPAPRPHT
jgi:hypothetical protein